MGTSMPGTVSQLEATVGAVAGGVERWIGGAAALTHAHGIVAHTVAVAPVSATQTSIVQDIQNWAYQWSPVVMMVFFAALIYLMWRTLKVMPRIKAPQLHHSSNESVTVADVAAG